MERDLKNKAVIITGGALGIGFCIADNFLSKGANIAIIIDINEDNGNAAVDSLNSKHGKNKADFFKLDVTTEIEQAFTEVFKKYNNIDVLVNNAGIGNPKDIKKMISLNVTAVMEASTIFMEKVRTDKGGKGGTVINLASIYGYRIDPFMPIYQGSKFAVLGFTKSFGHPYRLNRYGVRTVAVCPGFTETDLTKDMKVSDDIGFQKDFENFIKTCQWQKVDAAGKAVVEIFEEAETGTAWLIEGAKPIEQV